jgi:hypothetical protein
MPVRSCARKQVGGRLDDSRLLHNSDGNAWRRVLAAKLFQMRFKRKKVVHHRLTSYVLAHCVGCGPCWAALMRK